MTQMSQVRVLHAVQHGKTYFFVLTGKRSGIQSPQDNGLASCYNLMMVDPSINGSIHINIFKKHNFKKKM